MFRGWVRVRFEFAMINRVHGVLPPPLAGEGWGGGCHERDSRPQTPTPDPSPQGGGEKEVIPLVKPFTYAAALCRASSAW